LEYSINSFNNENVQKVPPGRRAREAASRGREPSRLKKAIAHTYRYKSVETFLVTVSVRTGTMNTPNHNDPHGIMAELYAIIAGLIGGGMYGMKIRLPHATVMTMLFRREASAKDKLRIVLQSTLEHSRNLASFATIYKVSYS